MNAPVGLYSYMIHPIVEHSTEFEICIFSEGASCHQKKDNFKLGQCGRWKGTIVYVRLSLHHKEAIASGKAALRKQFDQIKITLI